MLHEGSTVTITVEDFEAERPRLLRIAYRLTGSVVDAEDAVQEAWLRLDKASEKEEPSNLQALADPGGQPAVPRPPRLGGAAT